MNDEIKEQILDCFRNQRRLAKFVERTPAMVSLWLSGKQQIPVHLAHKIAMKMGVSLETIRPDLKL